MKSAPKTKPPKMDARAAKILKALRDARKEAVKLARMHGAPIVYMRGNKIVSEYPR